MTKNKIILAKTKEIKNLITSAHKYTEEDIGFALNRIKRKVKELSELIEKES